MLPHNEWGATTKPGKVYFTFFKEPRVPFDLALMKNAIKKAYQLADGKALELKEDAGRRQLLLSRRIIDPMATVVVVEIEDANVER